MAVAMSPPVLENSKSLIFRPLEGLFMKSHLLCALALACFFSTASAAEPESRTVTGQVYFERRSTIVPFEDLLEDCRLASCRRPRIYWSLVIKGNGVRYEVHKPYALG